MFFTVLYCCFDPLVYHSATNIQTKFCINMHCIYFMMTNSIVKMGRMFNSCWFFQLYNPSSVAQWHPGTIFSFAAISHASQVASLSSVSYLLQYMSHSTCLNITVSPSELHFFGLKIQFGSSSPLLQFCHKQSCVPSCPLSSVSNCDQTRPRPNAMQCKKYTSEAKSFSRPRCFWRSRYLLFAVCKVVQNWNGNLMKLARCQMWKGKVACKDLFLSQRKHFFQFCPGLQLYPATFPFRGKILFLKTLSRPQLFLLERKLSTFPSFFHQFVHHHV